MSNNNQRLMIESLVRAEFNNTFGTQTAKQRIAMPGGHAYHEFDMYQQGLLIGGISTSPWRNTSGSNNTGGQDRASSEILWLSLWNGTERRVHVLTDEDMATNLYRRYRGIPMKDPVEIYHYSIRDTVFALVGTLGV